MWYLLRLIIIVATIMYMWLHIDWQIALFCTLTAITLEILLRFVARLSSATNKILEEVKKIKNEHEKSL